jgi:hypothetical protein
VAVAGYVALLPHGQAEAHQVARIGLLQVSGWVGGFTPLAQVVESRICSQP